MLSLTMRNFCFHSPHKAQTILAKFPLVPFVALRERGRVLLVPRPLQLFKLVETAGQFQ